MRGMFVAGPVDPDGDHLRVHHAVDRTFGERTGQVLNPTMRGYVADLTAPYRLAVRHDLIERGAGHSYGEMCVPLLAGLVSARRPADLLVLATAIPDVRYGRATATYLSEHCPGAPLAFTVCDDGLLSAFTALHVIAGYARTGGCRRAVLLVAEQPTLYHELPVPTPVPDHAAAVGVTLETAGSRGALSVRRHAGVAADDVSDLLAGLSGDRTVVLLGPGLAGDDRGRGDNQPLTGIWRELSRGLPGWRDSAARVLLADYDPARGQLCTATVGFDG